MEQDFKVCVKLDRKPVELLENRSDMINGWSSGDNPNVKCPQTDVSMPAVSLMDCTFTAFTTFQPREKPTLPLPLTSAKMQCIKKKTIRFKRKKKRHGISTYM